MKVYVVDDLAGPVGTRWRQLQEEKTAAGREFLVAAPLSSTPLPVFRWIINHASTFPSWERVRFVLMDEQVAGILPPFTYVDVEDSASYEGFARKHLLGPLEEVTGVAVPVITPNLNNLDGFMTKLDLLLLAIGPNGNYANVMPGTPDSTGWHVAHLQNEFRHAHTAADSKSYAGARFREFGMSLGPQQVLEASEVRVIASGPKKASLVRHLLDIPMFSSQFPISIIHHPNIQQKVTVMITADTFPGGTA